MDGDHTTMHYKIKDSQVRKSNNQLEIYRGINRNVANKLDIAYVDMRKHFMNDFSSFVLLGDITIDGEHLNSRGIKAVANIFINQFKIFNGVWSIGDDKLEAYNIFPWSRARQHLRLEKEKLNREKLLIN